MQRPSNSATISYVQSKMSLGWRAMRKAFFSVRPREGGDPALDSRFRRNERSAGRLNLNSYRARSSDAGKGCRGERLGHDFPLGFQPPRIPGRPEVERGVALPLAPSPRPACGERSPAEVERRRAGEGALLRF